MFTFREDDEDEEEMSKSKMKKSLLKFINKSEKDAKLERHRFFKERCLHSVTSF